MARTDVDLRTQATAEPYIEQGHQGGWDIVWPDGARTAGLVELSEALTLAGLRTEAAPKFAPPVKGSGMAEPPPGANTQVNINGRWLGRGGEFSVKGESGRFTMSHEHNGEVTGFGGSEGKEMWRTFKTDRIHRVHTKEKRRSAASLHTAGDDYADDDAMWNAIYWRGQAENERRKQEGRQRLLAMKGQEVVVVKGRKIPLGTRGICFYSGEGQYGWRIGFTTEAGETLWTDVRNVELASDAHVAGFQWHTAHQSADPTVVSHCPFCGSGAVIARSDGNVECTFCSRQFTISEQPLFSALPGQAGPDGPADPANPTAPPSALATAPAFMDPEADPGDQEDDPSAAPAAGADPAGDSTQPPWAKGASLRTASGARLDEDAYALHLALKHGDRDAILAQVRS